MNLVEDSPVNVGAVLNIVEFLGLESPRARLAFEIMVGSVEIEGRF